MLLNILSSVISYILLQQLLLSALSALKEYRTKRAMLRQTQSCKTEPLLNTKPPAPPMANVGMTLYTSTTPGKVHIDFAGQFYAHFTPDEALALADLLVTQAHNASAADENRKPLFAVSEFLQKVSGDEKNRENKT